MQPHFAGLRAGGSEIFFSHRRRGRRGEKKNHKPTHRPVGLPSRTCILHSPLNILPAGPFPIGVDDKFPSGRGAGRPAKAVAPRPPH